MTKVTIERKQCETLKKKASFLADLVDLVEDKALGELMAEAEFDEEISLTKAKKMMT